MGITGLIPFLEKSSKKVNISEYSGCTVAIDTYCWLHKGAFSCADKIMMGQKTDAYVKYCMKYVNMLLDLKIKPILVFDGRHLPAKAETEIKRRESRDSNRKRAAELIKMGKVYEGKNLLRRCLDVSHKMALEVIKECQAQNVDCIVAPYEADAQLAYLNISGIADIVITEDSDLTLFGCTKIMFKMDLCGYGVLVEQENLHLAMGLHKDDFTLDKFRHMCILSGCDYLPSLPGIGLMKACKFVVRNRDPDIHSALVKLGSILNMKSLIVTKEYRDAFLKALVTFKHQLVFCPLTRQQKRLQPETSDVTEEQLKYAGNEVDHELAFQLALGNCEPFTFEKLHNFDPDNTPLRKKTNSWSESTKVTTHLSIWSSQFTVSNNTTTPKKKRSSLPTANSGGKVVTLNTDQLKEKITPPKRSYEEAFLTTDELIKFYQAPVDPEKETAKPCLISESDSLTDDEKTSPIIVKRGNPFKKTNKERDSSPSVLNRVRKRLPIRGSKMHPTVINEKEVCHSKFFHSKPDLKPETKLNNSNVKEEFEKETSSNTICGFKKEIFKNKEGSGYFNGQVSFSDDNEKMNILEEKISTRIASKIAELSRTREFENELDSQEKKFKYNFTIEENKVFNTKSKQSRHSISKPAGKSSSKKNTTIQGQQSLQMFGFRKQ